MKETMSLNLSDGWGLTGRPALVEAAAVGSDPIFFLEKR